MRAAILIGPGRNGRPVSKWMIETRGSMRVAVLCAVLAALGGADGQSEYTRPNFGLTRYPRPRRFEPDPRDALWDLLPEPKRPSFDEEERLVRKLLPSDAELALPLDARRRPLPLDTELALPLDARRRLLPSDAELPLSLDARLGSLPLDADREFRPIEDRLFGEGAGRFSEVVEYERTRLREKLREALMERGEELEREEGAEPMGEEVEPMGDEMEGAGPMAEGERDEDRFVGAELAERPEDFAYGPSDPRYFKKEEIAQEADFKPDPSPVQRSDPTRQRASSSPTPAPPGGVEVVAVRADAVEVDSAGVYVIAVVAGISAAATVGLIAVGIGWYNLQKHVKNASDVEYPAYGVTGPNKDLSPSGDRRLAQSAQMYHYQHQKQQIIAMERAQPGERHGSVSEVESDEENEEGDYTVYECPGLAPTGEMEVKNPLFQDEGTPAAQTPAKGADEKK